MIIGILKKIDQWLQRFLLPAPVVPPEYSVKRETIEKYAKDNSIHIFVETGTYLGETIDTLKNNFKKLISIELDKELYQKAKIRFKNLPHISILQGDSGIMLDSVIEPIHEPILFWLDGHWSGGVTARGEGNTPILKELEIISNHPIKNHIILIDDARCFNGENGYPTIKQLFDFIRRKNDQINFLVENDIIRITPETKTTIPYREPLRFKIWQIYRKLKKLIKRN